MRALLQRVNSAEVHINNQIYSQINKGLLILLGIGKNDDIKDIQYLIDKIINLRIFNNNQNKMNLSIKDMNGSALVISQFTLCGDTRKGRRPSFIKAAEPKAGNRLYEYFISNMKKEGIPVESGEFGATMNVELVNNGPVTFVLNSRY